MVEEKENLHLKRRNSLGSFYKLISLGNYLKKTLKNERYFFGKDLKKMKKKLFLVILAQLVKY